jgi:tetratricopeptide (TPR) repeat protein
MLSRIFGALLMAFLVMAQTKPDPQALYKAGYDARVAGDYAAAIRLLSEAIATGKLNNNDLATSYNNRGMAFAATDEADKAVADYGMAIELAPYYGPAYLNRGNVYSQQGKYDEAIAEFSLAIKISSTYVLAYNSRGAAYYRMGDLDAAMADLDTAIHLKPDYGNAF